MLLLSLNELYVTIIKWGLGSWEWEILLCLPRWVQNPCTKGFVSIRDLISVIVHIVLSISVAFLLLWFCNRRCIGFSFSHFPSMWNSCFPCCVIFLIVILPYHNSDKITFWIIFLFRSTNEMQSSYEWECDHLRPAYTAVSVLWVGEEPNAFAGSVWRGTWGEENCWQVIVALIFSFSSLCHSVLELREIQLDSIVFPAL